MRCISECAAWSRSARCSGSMAITNEVVAKFAARCSGVSSHCHSNWRTSSSSAGKQESRFPTPAASRCASAPSSNSHGSTRVSQDVPDQAQPPSWLHDSAQFSDGRLGVEPMPGVSREDRVERSVLNRNGGRVRLVAPGGRIVLGQDSKHACMWLDRLHDQAARQQTRGELPSPGSYVRHPSRRHRRQRVNRGIDVTRAPPVIMVGQLPKTKTSCGAGHLREATATQAEPARRRRSRRGRWLSEQPRRVRAAFATRQRI